MYTKRSIVVVVLVLLAGITGLVADELGSANEARTDGTVTTNAQPAGETPTPTDSQTPTRTPTTTPAPTPQLSGDTASPWDTTVVEVGINNSEYPGRNATKSALWAIEYWNENMQAYTDWDFTFRLVDEGDSDVELQVMDSSVDCDRDYVGEVDTDTSPDYACSPVYEREVTCQKT
jgi:hypothetical protein